MEEEQQKPVIDRHKTAIKRSSFSAPIKCMLRDGLLENSKTLLDYGCGHGRDLELLESMEIDCNGWDPKYRPDGDKRSADIVNLSYVINVIEDLEEREQTVRESWGLCKELFTVAAQIEFAAPDKEQTSYGDGVLTSRNTFQKYYNQHELQEYIQRITQVDAIPAAPGIFYVFRCEEAKQRFVASRYHRRITVPQRRISEVVFENNKDILEPLMESLAAYGRLPSTEEFQQTTEIIERLGSMNRAFKLIQKVTNESPWEEIAQKRTEDLLVYLALARFGKRPAISKVPHTIQNDIRAFIGSYKEACGQADDLLYKAGDREEIDAACKRSKVGQLVDNALIVHRSALDYLEPLLRIYEGCARALVGDLDDANVIKLHRYSGKISYLFYPDFEKKAHPAIKERIKVALPTQSINFYDYSHWEDPQLLFRKNELLCDDHEKKKLFSRLTRQEESLDLLPPPGDCFRASVWRMVLEQNRVSLKGHRLVKVSR